MDTIKVQFREPKKSTTTEPIITELVFRPGDTNLGSAKYISEYHRIIVVPCYDKSCCSPFFPDSITPDVPTKVFLERREKVYVAHRYIPDISETYNIDFRTDNVQLNENPESEIIFLGGYPAGSASCTLLRHGEQAIMIDCGVTPGRLQSGTEVDDEITELPSVYPDFNLIPDGVEVTGLIITHGHLDHYGGIAEYFKLLKVQDKPLPNIYGSVFTCSMVASFLELNDMVTEIGLLKHINNKNEIIDIGLFHIQPYDVFHSVPGSLGYAVHVADDPEAIVFTGDYKARFDSPIDLLDTVATFENLGPIKILLGDSTNALVNGLTGLESTVNEGLINAIRQTSGRVIITLFSSHIERIRQITQVAYRMNKRVAIIGSSFNRTLRAYEDSGKTISNLAIFNADQADIVIVAGCQGDDNSSARQLSLGNNVGGVRITPSDTVVFSALPIPGRKHAVIRMTKDFRELGAKVIIDENFKDNMFNFSREHVHVSGHGYTGDIYTVLQAAKPRYFVPVHCGKEQAQAAGKIALSVSGMEPDNIILFDSNGKSIVF